MSTLSINSQAICDVPMDGNGDLKTSNNHLFILLLSLITPEDKKCYMRSVTIPDYWLATLSNCITWI